MPPGDPNTRRGVTLTVPSARTFHTRLLSPARGLEVSRAGRKAGESSRGRLMAERPRHKSEKI